MVCELYLNKSVTKDFKKLNRPKEKHNPDDFICEFSQIFKQEIMSFLHNLFHKIRGGSLPN